MKPIKAKSHNNYTNNEFINLKIRKKDIESFCASAGLFKKEFLNKLDSSAKDHQNGLITSREELKELLSE